MTTKSTQVSEVRSRWSWAEPSVWSERMLATLETGVKGGRWYSLIDKVCSERNLRAAWRRVATNKGAAGVDAISVSDYERELEHNLAHLREALRTDRYTPLPNRRKWIAKGGSRDRRPLGIPTVRDRLAQCALKQVLEPIFEHGFAEHSYGFRPELGCKDALRAVQSALAEGWTHVIDADLKSYFDTIPHSRLVKRVAEKVSDGRVLALIETFLKQGVMEGLSLWHPETGTPQGAVISPLLSNIYLDPLDHLMASHGWRMVRYADDFVILCRTAAEAEEAMATLRAWVTDNCLQLHPDKTKMLDMAAPGAGFDFLGYHFQRVRNGRLRRWASDKSVKKFRDRVREYTPRKSGCSIECTISRLNPVLRGWYQYFRHSSAHVLDRLDGWVRMRLRSMLRRWHKRQGRGRGWDHLRWPNVYFRRLGLFSLVDAHLAERQSLRGTR